MNFDFFKPVQRSSFEHTIIAVLILILLALAVIKIIPMFGKVEQNYFENTRSQIDLIVRMFVSTQLLKGEPDAILAMVEGNPFQLIEKKYLPPNYLGELEHPDLSRMDGYLWYFDKSDHTLVYVVENERVFSSPKAGKAHIKFKLLLKFADKDKNAVFNKEIDQIEGLLLVPLNKYEWLVDTA